MNPARPAPLPYDIEDDARVKSRWDDALERGGEMLVLAGNDVTLLSPLATEAVLAAHGGVTVGDLERSLVQRFGSPPGGDSAAMVRELVASLISRGVMRLAD